VTITRLLHVVLVVEAVVAGLAVVVVFAHALWLKRESRMSMPRLARGRVALAEYFEGGAEEQDVALAVLAKFPCRVRTRLLEEASVGMRSGGTMTVAHAAGRLGLERRARRWCRSHRWWRRARGVHLLTLWDAVDVPAHLLTDRHPIVRARAIEWAGDHPRPELVELVLERLGDPTLLCRWRAEDAVLRAGAAATGPLGHRLDIATGPDLDVLLRLAARRPDSSFHAVALRLVADERPAVRAGAAAVLGALGGAEATAALEALLADPQPGPRVAAAEALGRLRHWPAATSVAALLSDPSWDARRAAAESLVVMGAPGTLLLGSHARGSDEDAARMARYALDVANLARGGQASVER